jgi:branched-subunit amino acid aminotransferase/4-amino-4-deoxychorismate lyase
VSTTDAIYQRFAMCNGSLVEAEALRVSPLRAGFMYGEGVFETIAVRRGRPVFFADHHARLEKSAAILEASAMAGCDALQARCLEVIAVNGMTAGSLKVVVFHGGTAWTELILARAHVYPATRYEAGFRLRTVAGDERVDPVHGLKSLNYLSNIRAKRAAQAAGFDEALFVDPQGRLLEGATTNVFVIRDGTVFTPPLSRGILPGVMRGRVLSLNGPVRFRACDLGLDDLRRAEEVFVTNALLGVMPVAQVDDIHYDLGRNAVTRTLRAALESIWE